MVSPGRYVDPAGSGRQRYFDGARWMENYHPQSVPAPSAWPTVDGRHGTVGASDRDLQRSADAPTGTAHSGYPATAAMT
ncbi:DUF2510 domain-containing protein [Mycobacterium sp. Y57]|uniref:DUF2510 domain-containing protein n=1 Tax=Mycolicibacterium xanthum TaxID=2796469 RepID=UPI001C848A7A|nr:DUF2510 domain-containing protein [Mycolicibacterium xanthum]